jgi:hypothetical protein
MGDPDVCCASRQVGGHRERDPYERKSLILGAGKSEILQQPVAESGDATVNPPIVGNGRDRSLRGNRVHNQPVQDRGNES